MNRQTRNQRILLICLLLACATLFAFWPVWRCGFVEFDDHGYVTENPQVRAGVTASGIVWAFRATDLSNWHPLTWLSHMLDCQLFGLSPSGHHLTSLLLHTANGLLLFLVLRRLTGAPWRSACVAALFALHPLRVESVAWVAERKDVLSALFFMLTLWAYALHAQTSEFRRQRMNGRTDATHHTPHGNWQSAIGNWKWYLLSLLFFALGLMSKPMLVTLPFVLLLLDYWPLRRFQLNLQPSTLNRLSPLLWEKAPFLLLSAACCAMTFYAQHAGGATVPTADLPLNLRVENALVSCARYLGKAFWPHDLAVFYPHPRAWPLWGVIAAAGLLVSVSVLVVRVARSRPYLLVGWLWFLGMLVPVIGLVQVGSQSMADRYTYLPLIGVFLLLVWWAADLSAGRPRVRWSLGLAAVAVLLACVATTQRQSRYWQNTEQLFEHALRVTRNNFLAHNFVGFIRYQQGKPEQAVAHLTEAIRANPNYADAHLNLGGVLLEQANLEGAVEHLNRALEIKPRRPDAHSNFGAELLKRGKVEEAEAHLRRALVLNPNQLEACNNLGFALLEQGKTDEAMVYLRRAVALNPNHASVHGNLARAYAAQGQSAQAARHFEEMRRLNPFPADAQPPQPPERSAGASAAASYHAGRVSAAQGDIAAAIAHFREALHVQPDNLPPLNDLAWILATHPDARCRNGAEAVGLAERAVALTRRQNAAMLDTLAAAYAEAGRFREAEATGREALSAAWATGNTNLARQVESRCNQYASQRPWREP